MAEHSGGFGLFLIILIVNLVSCQIPDSRLCVDDKCTGTISIAVVKEPFTATNQHEINLQEGAQIRVTSKNSHPQHQHWGGEVNGVFGYFPLSHVQEIKVLAVPNLITSITDKSESEFMAKAFENFEKTQMQQQSGNANEVELKDSGERDASTTAVPDLTEEGDGDEGEDEEGEDDEGLDDEEDGEDDEDEEGSEGEEGDETETGEVEENLGNAEVVNGDKVKPPETNTNQEEVQPNANPDNPSATESTDGGGLLSSIGNMFGGMFGGGKEEPDQPTVQQGRTENAGENTQSAETHQPEMPETKDASSTQENKDDPTEVADGPEEGNNDDRMRTIQAEQLARIRNNFLRRRVPNTNPPADGGPVGDLNEINEQLEKKYMRMKDPPQYRAPPNVAEDNLHLHNVKQNERTNPTGDINVENVGTDSGAQNLADINKQLDEQRQEFEELRRRQVEIKREAELRRLEQEKERHKQLIEEQNELEQIKKRQEVEMKKIQEEQLQTMLKEEQIKREQVDIMNKHQEFQEAQERQEQKKKLEEEQLKADEVLKLQHEQLRQAQEEERVRLEAERVQKMKQEEEMRKIQEEELKKKQEEEQLKKKQEEELKKKQLEEELKKKQEEEIMKRQVEELKKMQEEELRKKQEEELRKKQEEELRKKQEEEIRKKQEEEMRKQQEEELRKKHEEETRKKQADEMRQQEEIKRTLRQKKEAELEIQKVREEHLKRQQEITRQKIQLQMERNKSPDSTQVNGNVQATILSSGTTLENENLEAAPLPHASTLAVTDEKLTLEELQASDLTSPIMEQNAPPTMNQQEHSPQFKPTLVAQSLETMAVPTPTPADTQQKSLPEVKPIEISAHATEMIQPSTPTPSGGVRPSVLPVPPTETTRDPIHLSPGSPPGDEAVSEEEGAEEEAEDGEEGMEGEDEDRDEEDPQGEDGPEEEDGTEVEAENEASESAGGEGNMPTVDSGNQGLVEDQKIDPTSTSVSEEVEQTVTGSDGLRSVVFDGTTLPLDELPPNTNNAEIEMSSSILSSPATEVPNLGATPPLNDVPASTSVAVDANPIPTVEIDVVDIPMTHTIQQDSTQASAVQDPGSNGDSNGIQSSDDAQAEIDPLLKINDTHAPAPSGKSEFPSPNWQEYQSEDPYVSSDFVSRRPLQSQAIDEGLNDNNEQNNDFTGQDHGFAQDTEHGGFPEEGRMDPEGQEDAPQAEGDSVTPAPSDEEEVPPILDDITIEPTPPTLEEEVVTPAPEEGTKTGFLRSLVSFVDGVLQFVDPVVDAIIGVMPPSVTVFLSHEPFGLSKPRAALLAVITAVMFASISITSCLGAFGSKKGKDPLAKVAKLEDELFVANKERDELQHIVEKLKNEVQTVGRRTAMSEDDLASRDKELQTIQLHNAALKKTADSQETKIKDLTETNTQYQSAVAEKDSQLEQLMYQNNQLQEQFNTSAAQLQESWQLMTAAQTQAAELQVQYDQINEEVTILTESKDQLQLEVTGWSEKVRDLDDEISQLKEQLQEKDKLNAYKDSELEVMRDCFLQLKAMETSADGSEGDQPDGDGEPSEGGDQEPIGADEKVQEKIRSMMDVSKVNAQLHEVTEERDKLRQTVEIEVEARKEMEDQMQKLQTEMTELKRGHQQAEQQSKEATTKLNVLASYFKEKEIELQQSLGEQVVRHKESQETLLTADEKSQKMEQEMATYRKQVDDLKKEIENVERDFRTQIAANEKKAHENWLAARQAERNLKEAKNEAALLRQKLVEMETSKDLNGPIGLIRPLPTRGMPPPGVGPLLPPGMPLPGPPPLGPLPGDRPMSRGSGIPPSPHMRDDEFLPPPRGRPPPMMDRDRPLPPPGGRLSPPGGWGPGGRGQSPPHFDQRSPPPFDRRSPPFDRRGPPPPHDRRSPPPPMFRGPPPPERRGPPPQGPPPPGYRSPDGPYRRTPPHGRPYPHDLTPPPEFRKGSLDPRDPRDLRMKDPRTSSPYDRPNSSASRGADLPPPSRSQNYP